MPYPLSSTHGSAPSAAGIQAPRPPSRGSRPKIQHAVAPPVRGGHSEHPNPQVNALVRDSLNLEQYWKLIYTTAPTNQAELLRLSRLILEGERPASPGGASTPPLDTGRLSNASPTAIRHVDSADISVSRAQPSAKKSPGTPTPYRRWTTKDLLHHVAFGTSPPAPNPLARWFYRSALYQRIRGTRTCLSPAPHSWNKKKEAELIAFITQRQRSVALYSDNRDRLREQCKQRFNKLFFGEDYKFLEKGIRDRRFFVQRELDALHNEHTKIQKELLQEMRRLTVETTPIHRELEGLRRLISQKMRVGLELEEEYWNATSKHRDLQKAIRVVKRELAALRAKFLEVTQKLVVPRAQIRKVSQALDVLRTEFKTKERQVLDKVREDCEAEKYLGKKRLDANTYYRVLGMIDEQFATHEEHYDLSREPDEKVRARLQKRLDICKQYEGATWEKDHPAPWSPSLEALDMIECDVGPGESRGILHRIQNKDAETMIGKQERNGETGEMRREFEKIHKLFVNSGKRWHPNLILPHALAQAGGSEVLLMEAVEAPGADAFEVLTQLKKDFDRSLKTPKAPGAISPIEYYGTLAFIVKRLLSVQDFLRLARFTHNDIKPHNILIHPSGEPLVCDFGDMEEFGVAPVRSTPQFTAPERMNSTWRQYLMDANLLENTPARKLKAFQEAEQEGRLFASGTEKSEVFQTGATLFFGLENEPVYRKDGSMRPVARSKPANALSDFMQQLLNADPARRAGVIDAKMHEFLDGFWDFDDASARKVLRNTLARIQENKEKEQLQPDLESIPNDTAVEDLEESLVLMWERPFGEHGKDVETLLADIDKESLDVWSVPLDHLIEHADILDQKLELAEAALSEVTGIEQRRNSMLQRNDTNARKSMTNLIAVCAAEQTRREALVQELTRMRACVGQVIAHVEARQRDEIETICSSLFSEDLLESGRDVLARIDALNKAKARIDNALRDELKAVRKKLGDDLELTRQLAFRDEVQILEERGFQSHMQPPGRLGLKERLKEGERLRKELRKREGRSHGEGRRLSAPPENNVVQVNIPSTKAKKANKANNSRFSTKSFLHVLKDRLNPLRRRAPQE